MASNRESPGVFSGRKGLLLAALLPLGLLVRMHRLRFPAFFIAVIAALLLSFVASCGSGAAGNGGGGGGGGGGSQSQTYVLTITGTPDGTALSQTLGTITVTVTQ